MRRDAYLAQAVMEARAKEAERETVINELVCIYLLLPLYR